MAKVGRNSPCPCGSRLKFKKCCLNKVKPQPLWPSGPLKLEKVSDIGTSYPPMSRLGLGMMELLDFSSLSGSVSDVVKGNSLEAARLLHESEEIAKPIIAEIKAIRNDLEKNGVQQDSNGSPMVPGTCKHLSESRKCILLWDRIAGLFFSSFNSIWDVSFSRTSINEFKEFLVYKFGGDHILSMLINDDIGWVHDLNGLISLSEDAFDNHLVDFKVEKGGPGGKFLVTLPSFSNELQISDYLEVLNHNLMTFTEEFLVFSINEFLDERLVIHDLDEKQRDPDAPVRFKVGVKEGVDLKEFKGHPKLDKIFKSGQRLYHLKDQLRQGKYGRVRPIIHADYRGKKGVAVGNTICFGNWKTFVDFLFDYIKMKFGKKWWLGEAKKEFGKRSPLMDLARQTYQYQKKHQKNDGEIYLIDTNGPMHSYLSIAYDLYILEDNQKLQATLIERMKQQDRPNFWGARYEAMTAAVFIKSGFNIQYEDESDRSEKHPEFIAVHKETGEEIAVEAKKKNRQSPPYSEEETKLRITKMIGDAVKKFKGKPYVLFLELDLPPIEGDPMKKPWIKQLLNSSSRAGVRDSDGKDFINMIVFTNYPTEHPDDPDLYPARSYIVSQTLVPKVSLKNPIHLPQIVSTVEKNAKIPSWFEE